MNRTLVPLLILGALFFLFGFVTWINGPLISYLKIVCELREGAEPFYVASAFYMAYFFTALPMAAVLRRTGLKRGMMYGLLIMAAGALLFVPAAQWRSYPLFLLGLFTIGTGLALLQTASNPYITIVGPMESAAARISAMGICNKLAGVLAPIVLGAVLLGDAATLQDDLRALEGAERAAFLDALAARVTLPYLVMAAVLAALGAFVRFSPLPELDPGAGDRSRSSWSGVIAHPALVLGVVALFWYVGVEVIAVDTIGVYGEAVGVPLEHAKLLPSYTLLAMVLSYAAGIVAIPRYISQARALAWSAALGVVLAIGVVVVPLTAVVQLPMLDLGALTITPATVPLSIVLLALLGLANALMWPAIWPLAIAGLGRLTPVGSALLIMAIVGGAVLTPLYGACSQLPSLGPQGAYLLLLPGYLVIGWYALHGHRLKAWGRPSRSVEN
jgi:glucose/galactose transporter